MIAAAVSVPGADAALAQVLHRKPVAIVDGAARILHWSSGCERLYGLGAAAALGRNKHRLLRARDSRDGTPVWPPRRDDRVRRLFEARPDGVSVEVMETVERLDDVGAEARYALWMADVGIGATVDGDPIAAAEAHARLVGRFAAHVTHEISQPLAAIVNFAAAAERMLQRGCDEARVIEMLHRVSGQAIRARAIVSGLSASAVRRAPVMRTVPVAATLRDPDMLAVVEAERQGIRLVYELDPAAAAMRVDRGQIQQVVVNLLRNSVQALRDAETREPLIAVRSRAVGDGQIEIAICDNGPGIAAGALARLFEPFVTTKGEEGMGLGLSICRSIVQAHGGTIGAANPPEGGACVTFSVAQAGADAIAPA